MPPVVNDLIKQIPTSCKWPGCEAALTRSVVKQHEANCQHRRYNCKGAGCEFEGRRAELEIHRKGCYKLYCTMTVEKKLKQVLGSSC